VFDINTRILGLVGYPLGHSISPLLHNSTIKERGLNYIYLPFQVEEERLREVIEGLKALNFRGINITIPYKKKVLPLLDSIAPQAVRIGSVNTIVNEENILTGYNTDFTGLIRMIKEDGGFDIRGKKVLIIGAGGTASTAGTAVLSEGAAAVYLLNRTSAKGEKLVEKWRKDYPDTVLKAGPLEPIYYNSFIKEIELLIDTTPVGMAPEIDEQPVITASSLHSNMLVVDLVYNPEKTTLLKAAEKAGAAGLNGMGMLLYQGIESFKLWTGYEIDPGEWRKLTKSAK